MMIFKKQSKNQNPLLATNENKLRDNPLFGIDVFNPIFDVIKKNKTEINVVDSFTTQAQPIQINKKSKLVKFKNVEDKNSHLMNDLDEGKICVSHMCKCNKSDNNINEKQKMQYPVLNNMELNESTTTQTVNPNIIPMNNNLVKSEISVNPEIIPKLSEKRNIDMKHTQKKRKKTIHSFL